MYTIFFAAFVLMVLTVFSNSEAGGSEPVAARSDAVANGLVKPAIRREYLLVSPLVGAGVVALVGLYLRQG